MPEEGHPPSAFRGEVEYLVERVETTELNDDARYYLDNRPGLDGRHCAFTRWGEPCQQHLQVDLACKWIFWCSAIRPNPEAGARAWACAGSRTSEELALCQRGVYSVEFDRLTCADWRSCELPGALREVDFHRMRHAPGTDRGFRILKLLFTQRSINASIFPLDEGGDGFGLIVHHSARKRVTVKQISVIDGRRLVELAATADIHP